MFFNRVFTQWTVASAWYCAAFRSKNRCCDPHITAFPRFRSLSRSLRQGPTPLKRISSTRPKGLAQRKQGHCGPEALKPQSRSTSTSGWRPQNDESGLVDTSNVVWVGYGNFELFNPAARRVRIKRHFTRFKAILTHLHGSLRM